MTIKNLTVRGFDGFGVFGFGTDRLSVTGVHALFNTEYGITEFNSTRGKFIGNVVIGSIEEAGLYVGDIANAHGTVVKDNVAIGNALGLLVRHAHNVTVTGNRFIRNCTGVALVDDGQPGGQGDTVVMHNVIDRNNRSCPAGEDAPPLQGTGVLIFGGHDNTIKNNEIIGNRGRRRHVGGRIPRARIRGQPRRAQRDPGQQEFRAARRRHRRERQFHQRVQEQPVRRVGPGQYLLELRRANQPTRSARRGETVPGRHRRSATGRPRPTRPRNRPDSPSRPRNGWGRRHADERRRTSTSSRSPVPRRRANRRAHATTHETPDG